MLYFVIAGLATCVALPTYYIEEDCGPYIVVLIYCADFGNRKIINSGMKKSTM